MTFEAPKLKLLYYKNILDNCFIKFFEDFNDDFKNEDGQYVYAKIASKSKLKHVFKCYIRDELKQYVVENSVSCNSFFFIIGSCIPRNNILLNYKDGYFPEKLQRIVDSQFRIKYFLKEKGIKLDLVFFNSVFEEIFNELFKSQDKILKLLGGKYTSLFFIQHSKLDCLTLYKTVKYLYGKNNVVNLHKEHFKDSKTIIYSVNECIDKYVHNKKALNQSDEFKLIVKEISQYISECMRIANGKK